MTLTVGGGPFGQHPTGRFDFDPPAQVTFVEVHPRRVRGMSGGETVVDSERVKLVYRTGSLPHFAFPAEDVDVAAEPDPAVDGYVTVPWGAVETWLEEDDEIIVHPRDPYHRIDVLNTSRRIVVRVAGEEVARTEGAKVLFETALPPRYYLPRDDVRMEALSRSLVRTGCAYKGYAEHFDIGSVPSIAWSYREPRHEAELARDRVAFYQERPEVELELDGQIAPRPQTPWSRVNWISRYLGSSADPGGAAATTDR
jgi:uncharacterized protein (DUF427 family)